MSKIEFDKYYTSPIVARYCIDKTYEVIGKDNITEIVETSAGCGSFSHQIEGCKAYDLFPQHESIMKADYLDLDLGGYKKGRLNIGNPPYGAGTKQILKNFYDKACKEGDYISWILPRAHHNSYERPFNRFEIVHSEQLKTEFTNHILRTALVIYKRHPIVDQWYNIEYKPKKEFIKFTQYARVYNVKKLKRIEPYDYTFVTWGDLLRETKPYEKARTVGVKIHQDYRLEVIQWLQWMYRYNRQTGIITNRSISAGILGSLQPLYKLMHIQFPELFDIIKPWKPNE